jgi:hypothetical protein
VPKTLFITFFCNPHAMASYTGNGQYSYQQQENQQQQQENQQQQQQQQQNQHEGAVALATNLLASKMNESLQTKRSFSTAMFDRNPAIDVPKYQTTHGPSLGVAQSQYSPIST